MLQSPRMSGNPHDSHVIVAPSVVETVGRCCWEFHLSTAWTVMDAARAHFRCQATLSPGGGRRKSHLVSSLGGLDELERRLAGRVREGPRQNPLLLHETRGHAGKRQRSRGCSMNTAIIAGQARSPRARRRQASPASPSKEAGSATGHKDTKTALARISANDK